jgi:hypothetical protein
MIPITRRGRQTGTAKLKIKEMGSRYMFSWLHVWLEKHLTRGIIAADDWRLTVAAVSGRNHL